MKIIHTFCTQKFKVSPINTTGGWLANESYFMCWALSCLNAKKIYGQIELYTDQLGAEILIDEFELPYDKVHLVFDNSIATEMPDNLWAISKIITYSIQKEPFIHIDGDFIFWEKINLNKNIIFQNLEVGLGLYSSAFVHLKEKYDSFLECNFTRCLNSQYINQAANLGIFGGNDTSFIIEFAKDILEFIKKNIHHLNYSELELMDINCFFEQYYFHYLCVLKDKKYTTIHAPTSELINLKHQVLFNQPNANNGFSHFLGSCKKKEIINTFVINSLSEHYPGVYKKIKKKMSSNFHHKYFVFDPKNIGLDVNRIKNDFLNKLENNNIQLNEELFSDFNKYWDTKSSLYQKMKFVNNTQIPNSKIDDLFWMNNNLKIRLSGTFICVNKYLKKWDILFLSDAFIQNTEEQPCFIPNKYNYCIFFITPVESTLCSDWVSDVFAYIFLRILNKEYLGVENIIKQVKILLSSNTEDSLNKIKQLLSQFLTKFYHYGIIEVQTCDSNLDSSNIFSI